MSFMTSGAVFFLIFVYLIARDGLFFVCVYVHIGSIFIFIMLVISSNPTRNIMQDLVKNLARIWQHVEMIIFMYS